VNVNDFINKAKKGVVTVEFRKVDTGELRIMPCTLNRELSGDKVPEIFEQRAVSDYIAVWCLDKNDWRSFRVNTVERWYEGESA